MKNLLWLDLETTGLNPQRDRILMVAVARANDAGEIIEEASAGSGSAGRSLSCAALEVQI